MKQTKILKYILFLFILLLPILSFSNCSNNKAKTNNESNSSKLIVDHDLININDIATVSTSDNYTGKINWRYKNDYYYSIIMVNNTLQVELLQIVPNTSIAISATFNGQTSTCYIGVYCFENNSQVFPINSILTMDDTITGLMLDNLVSPITSYEILYIPRFLRGVEINAIADEVINGNTNALYFEKIIFANDAKITYIGNSNFTNLPLLEYINMSNEINYIGHNSFNDIPSLVNVHFSTNISDIGNDCFSSNVNAKILNDYFLTISNSNYIFDIFVPNDNYILYSCEIVSSINILTIDNKITHIARDLNLINTANITRIVVNNNSNLVDINQYAFANLDIVNVEILNNISNIYDGAFSNNALLETVNITSNNIITLSPYLFYNCSSLTTFTINNSSKITTIGSYAFYDCSNLLMQLDISSLTNIGNYAFYNNIWINQFSSGNNLKTIGEYAFAKSSIVKFIANKILENIGSYAFFQCQSLVDVNLSQNENIVSFNDYVFSECILLTNISYPKSLLENNYTIFYMCNDLFVQNTSKQFFYVKNSNNEKVYYVRTDTDVICLGANGNDIINDVHLYVDTTEIYNKAFANTSLNAITFNNKLKIIGAYSFFNTQFLTTISFPTSLTNIREYAFAKSQIATVNMQLLNNITFDKNIFLFTDNIDENSFTLSNKFSWADNVSSTGYVLLNDDSHKWTGNNNVSNIVIGNITVNDITIIANDSSFDKVTLFATNSLDVDGSLFINPNYSNIVNNVLYSTVSDADHIKWALSIKPSLANQVLNITLDNDCEGIASNFTRLNILPCIINSITLAASTKYILGSLSTYTITYNPMFDIDSDLKTSLSAINTSQAVFYNNTLFSYLANNWTSEDFNNYFSDYIFNNYHTFYIAQQKCSNYLFYYDDQVSFNHKLDVKTILPISKFSFAENLLSYDLNNDSFTLEFDVNKIVLNSNTFFKFISIANSNAKYLVDNFIMDNQQSINSYYAYIYNVYV